MQQLAQSIDRFLTFQEYDILEGHGKITSKVAKDKAKAEYQLFNKTQKINSDFEKLLKQLTDDKNFKYKPVYYKQAHINPISALLPTLVLFTAWL